MEESDCSAWLGLVEDVLRKIRCGASVRLLPARCGPSWGGIRFGRVARCDPSWPSFARHARARASLSVSSACHSRSLCAPAALTFGGRRPVSRAGAPARSQKQGVLKHVLGLDAVFLRSEFDAHVPPARNSGRGVDSEVPSRCGRAQPCHRRATPTKHRPCGLCPAKNIDRPPLRISGRSCANTRWTSYALDISASS